MKLSDYVFSFLERLGIQDVFMLSGGGCMHLCDSLGRSGLNYVCCLHEQAAAIAALAYAQYKNEIGVALVTTGPGSTNALTGVLGAWDESAPLLIVSGQVKTADISGESGVRMLGFQEAPTAEMARPITKYAVTVTDPQTIRYHLEKAVHLARAGRPGPVWIDIPLDVQTAQIEPDALAAFTPEPRDSLTDSGTIDTIRTLLAEAERPVIIGGYGIRLAGAADDFVELVRALNVPVLLTWKAADLLADEEPLFFGRPGTAGQRGANFVLQNCDLLIALGARLDFGQIGFDHKTFARAAKKVIVDIDRAEVSKFKFKVDLPVCGDVRTVIRGLLQSSSPRPSVAGWIGYCARVNEKYPVVLPEHRTTEGYVSTYALAEELSAQLGPADLFVPGSSGMCSDIPMQVFKFKSGQRAVNSPGIGSMGFGIPSALGVCIASGKKRVVCTNGDGGFQMNIQELETIRRLNLPVKFFVLNNDGYGSIKMTQRNYFGGFYVGSNGASGVTLPDVCKVAEAFGFRTFRLTSSATLKSTVRAVLAEPGPVVCEVRVHPLEIIEPKASSAVGPDGKMASKPLEDLSPFLPRAEFLENMLIAPVFED